jgi:hypothetical protein
MQLRIVTRKTGDGVDASVPSIRECETWARTEDEALAILLERIGYFLQLPEHFRHSLDRQHRGDGETWYALSIPDRNPDVARPPWHELFS